MLTTDDVLRALDAAGVEARLVPRHKGSTGTCVSPGIWYLRHNDVIAIATAMTGVLGKERWDELMKTAQVDNAPRGRVLYFPGEELS